MSNPSTAPYSCPWTIIQRIDHFLCMYLAYNYLQTCTHITCSQVRPPQLTHSSPDLYLRATSVCVPSLHRFMFLYCDLSHACIDMFKSHLIHPYYTDDLWTTVHCNNMGHHLFHRNRLTIPKFLLSSFLTPKRMKRSSSIAASFPTR